MIYLFIASIFYLLCALYFVYCVSTSYKHLILFKKISDYEVYKIERVNTRLGQRITKREESEAIMFLDKNIELLSIFNGSDKYVIRYKKTMQGLPPARS